MNCTSLRNIGPPAITAVVGIFSLTQGCLRADIFNVDVSSPALTLYTDPNPPHNEIKAGGFSGLYPVPGDATRSLFYAVSDRGPTADHPTVVNGKVFPLAPESPGILKLQLLSDGTAQILEIIPLRKPGGAPVTGLPNRSLPASEVGFDMFLAELPDDPDGLDVEGLTMDAAGNFWICEEYRPSVCRVAPDGTVNLRLVPQGSPLGGNLIPTFDVLPALLAKRRANRGLEGVAFSHGHLYAIMQRPLNNPSQTVGNASRNVRIIDIDIAGLAGANPAGVVLQYLYLTEPNASQANVLLSDIFSLSPSLFLVGERRTDKLFAINMAPATDITPLENPLTGKLLSDPARTIEQLTPAELAQLGVRTVKKAVVVPSLKALEPLLDKVEGVAVSGRTIVLCHDNDFNFLGANFSTSPATVLLITPPNLPKVVTTPLPEEVEFSE